MTIPHVNGTGFLPRIIVFTDGVVTPELVTDCEDYVPQGRDALEVSMNYIESCLHEVLEMCSLDLTIEIIKAILSQPGLSFRIFPSAFERGI